MSNTLVTVLGGAGFIGRTMIERWPRSDRSNIRLVVRRSRPNWLENCGARVQVARDDDELVEAIASSETIINLLRPCGDGLLPPLLARAFFAATNTAVRRFIHCSSIDVYGRVAENWIDEDTVPLPVTPYEREHLRAEEIVASTSVETCILRIGVVFGPGGRNLRSLALETNNASRVKLIARRALYGFRRMHLVSAEKVADTIRHLALKDVSLVPKRIIVTDDEAFDNNFAFVQDTFLRVIGRPELGRVPVLPAATMKLVLQARGRSNTNPNRRFANQTYARLGLPSNGTFQSLLERHIRDLVQRNSLAEL